MQVCPERSLGCGIIMKKQNEKTFWWFGTSVVSLILGILILMRSLPKDGTYITHFNILPMFFGFVLIFICIMSAFIGSQK